MDVCKSSTFYEQIFFSAEHFFRPLTFLRLFNFRKIAFNQRFNQLINLYCKFKTEIVVVVVVNVLHLPRRYQALLYVDRK